MGRGETREDGGERGKGATATRRRAYDEREIVEGRLGFLVSLWMACVSRVTPQIALAGAVGAGAQWLKLSACDETERYSTTCRYAFNDRSALRGVGGAVVLAGVSRGAGV